jgi:hypothetical protein
MSIFPGQIKTSGFISFQSVGMMFALGKCQITMFKKRSTSNMNIMPLAQSGIMIPLETEALHNNYTLYCYIQISL